MPDSHDLQSSPPLATGFFRRIFRHPTTRRPNGQLGGTSAPSDTNSPAGLGAIQELALPTPPDLSTTESHQPNTPSAGPGPTPGQPGHASDLVKPTDITAIPALDFVVGAPFYFARGTVSTLFGLGGAGKSSFAISLAAHIALGRPFIGAETTKGRVFYAEFEGAGQLLATATRKVITALEEDQPGAAVILERDFKQRHFTPREKATWGYARGMIPAMIDLIRGNYDVIIIDSFEAAAMIDSNDPQSVAALMMIFNELASETNTAVILIDHAPKHNRGTVFGSTKKTDFARSVVRIEGTSSNVLKLHSEKCNVAPKPTFPDLERRETETTLRFCEQSLFRVDVGGRLSPDTELGQLIERAIASGSKTRTDVYGYVQQALELTSVEAARKRIERANLQDLLQGLTNGRS